VHHGRTPGNCRPRTVTLLAAVPLFAAILFIAPALAHGQTITARWDPNPSSDQVTGYQVCVGTSSLSCNVQLASVGASQNGYTFSPTGGVLHYVAVRAVGASGASSYSTEVSFSIPGLSQPANRYSTVSTAITPFNLSASDPDGGSLSYSHTGLPVGLWLDQTGRVSGTPAAVGTYSVTVFVSDNLVTVSRSFTWTITSASGADTTAPALAITSHNSSQTVSSSTVTISGTASDSGRGGSGIASVRVNGLWANGGTASGNGTASWSRSLSLSYGANTITVEALDGTGNLSMQQITLNRASSSSSASTTVTAVGVTPNNGTGMTQAFALQYSDSAGATDLRSVAVLFSASLGDSSNHCIVNYDRGAGTLYLKNDSGTTWMPASLGGSGTLQNSQCAIALGSSGVSTSGTTLTLNLAMSFKAAYAGARNIYMYAAGSSADSGWQSRGTWTVPGSTSSVWSNTTPTVTALGVTPSGGTGATQLFALQYSDSLGATDLRSVAVLFSASLGASSNHCIVNYDRGAGTLYLKNDSGTWWMPASLGGSGTLQNSQCAIALGGSGVSTSGTALTLNLAMSFKAAYAGTKNIYMYAAGSSADSGWQARGTWTVP